MQLHKVNRTKIKIRMAVQGPSGSGKTYSALLAAYGLCGDWNKIAVIDTENQSADLYASLGPYNVLHLAAPFTPERYIDAIALCEQSAIQVIILDSLSAEWEGTGGILETHSRMAGNSFTNWGKLTPRHNLLVQAILQSPVHIIATLRKKQDYILAEKNGKMVPEKVGLKSIQREGIDYEFTLVFDLDMQHNAVASKDRTGIFMDKPGAWLSSETGQAILQWCQEGLESPSQNNSAPDINQQIQDCRTMEALLSLYKSHPSWQAEYHAEFSMKKSQLLLPAPLSGNHKNT